MKETMYPYRQWVTGTNLAYLQRYDSRYFDYDPDGSYAYDTVNNDWYSDGVVDSILEELEEEGRPVEGWEFEFHCEPNPDWDGTIVT